MNKNLRTSTLAFSLIALMGVTGCKMDNTPIVGTALDGLAGMHDETEARLATSAQNAIAAGKTDQALALYAKLYNQNATQDVSLNYAQLLRKTGEPKQALAILAPFVTDGSGAPKDDAAPVMLNEYAATSIELGQYHPAEIALERVLKSKKDYAFHADAYDLLGVALDAQGWHQEAEQNYKQALAGWRGDPTAVMNNLGLCLAAQGLFDQSLTMLRQALVKAPHKTEIARNIKMVSELRKDFVPTAPISIVPPPAPQKKK